MAKKNKVKVTSHFKAAAKAGDQAVHMAMAHALEEGADWGRKKITMQTGKRGYNLTPDSLQTHLGPREAVISLDEWWWRFFEFGTVYIPAMPSLRPAHRKARRVLIADLEGDFENWIRMKAQVRKT